MSSPFCPSKRVTMATSGTGVFNVTNSGTIYGHANARGAAAVGAAFYGWTPEFGVNPPILESFSRPEDYKGIDILRTIRSFDPCMPCTTHIHTDQRVISREVTTCACGFDD